MFNRNLRRTIRDGRFFESPMGSLDESPPNAINSSDANRLPSDFHTRRRNDDNERRDEHNKLRSATVRHHPRHSIHQ